MLKNNYNQHLKLILYQMNAIQFITYFKNTYNLINQDKNYIKQKENTIHNFYNRWKK